MRTTTLLCTLLAALTLALAAAPAAAQETQAREHFARGTSAYQSGDYDTAIREWTLAYTADPRPLIQYNLSQAYERAGRIEEAATALDAYLAHAQANDPNQAEARARVASIRERILRTAVHVSGGPEGATILVDGQDHGRTPHPDPINVSPGQHTVVVRARGFEDFNSAVSVPAGQAVEVQVTMQAESGGGGGGGGGTPAPAPSPDILPPLLVAGGGAVVSIVGLIIGGVALGNASSAPASTGPEADSARGLALGADICIWGGLAIAAAGGIWLALTLTSSPSTPAETQHASLAPQLHVAPFLGPHEGGATALVTF